MELELLDTPYGIRDVFARLCPKLVANKKLWKQLREINNRFITRNDDHIRFFGSTLLGCYTVRYGNSEDRKRWFDEVLQVPEAEVKQALLNPPLINTSYRVACDILTLSFTYVVYLCLTSTELNEKQRRESAMNVMRQMYYRYFGSWMSNHFTYPCSYESALTVYNSLSKRFDIKNYGSWSRLIDDKIDYLLFDKKSPHYTTFRTLKENDEYMEVGKDVSTRVHAVLDLIYDRHKTLAGDSKNRVMTSEDTITIDGDVIMREKTSSVLTYKTYIGNIINTKSFIRRELVDVVLDAMDKARRDYFMATLQYLSLNYGKSKFKHIAHFVELDIVYSFEIMYLNKMTFSSSADIVQKLRSKFMAPKGSDPELLELRKLGEQLVDEATHLSKYASSYAPNAERTALMLYIMLRALSMNYYR
jgi:hypothetical protein